MCLRPRCSEAAAPLALRRLCDARRPLLVRRALPTWRAGRQPGTKRGSASQNSGCAAAASSTAGAAAGLHAPRCSSESPNCGSVGFSALAQGASTTIAAGSTSTWQAVAWQTGAASAALAPASCTTAPRFAARMARGAWLQKERVSAAATRSVEASAVRCASCDGAAAAACEEAACATACMEPGSPLPDKGRLPVLMKLLWPAEVASQAAQITKATAMAQFVRRQAAATPPRPNRPPAWILPIIATLRCRPSAE